MDEKFPKEAIIVSAPGWAFSQQSLGECSNSLEKSATCDEIIIRRKDSTGTIASYSDSCVRVDLNCFGENGCKAYFEMAPADALGLFESTVKMLKLMLQEQKEREQIKE